MSKRRDPLKQLDVTDHHPVTHSLSLSLFYSHFCSLSLFISLSCHKPDSVPVFTLIMHVTFPLSVLYIYTVQSFLFSLMCCHGISIASPDALSS